MIRTLIVAPYASLRAELEARLSDTEGCSVIGAAAGSDEIEAFINDLHAEGIADVLLVAFNEEEESEDQEERKRLFALASHYELGVVLLDDQPQSIRQMAASEVAAWGVMRHDTDSQELAAAIRAVAAGLVVVDRALIGLVTAPRAEVSVAVPVITAKETPLPFETLTAREHQVLQLMAQGLANKQIGGRLSISLHTVKFHVASILAKFGAMSRTEAVTLGARRGLVIL